MTDVTIFEVGESLGWCLKCSGMHRGNPDACPHCGAPFTGKATAQVTKVDRDKGTFTVESKR